MGLQEVVQRAVQELVELTGCSLSGVTAACRQGDGWLLRVELVERRGVPDSMDLLGLYEVRADEQGQLQEFARKGLRRRGEVAGELDELPVPELP